MPSTRAPLGSCLALLVSALAVWPVRAGRAQDLQVAPAPAGYREAIDVALQELRLSNFLEAREQFARAHALSPSARTLRGLGIAEFELKHYVAAADYLTASLAAKVKPLDAALRAEVAALVQRTQAYVGAYTIDLQPKSASLRVDGMLEIREFGAPVRLAVGEHLLEFLADGHAPERRQISVRGGQMKTLTVRLASLSSGPDTAQLPPRDDGAAVAEDKPLYKRWWLWTALGAVVLGGAVATAVALNPRQRDAEPFNAGHAAQRSP